VSVSVAAPVYGTGNAVVAGLSIVVPARGVQARRYVPAVLAAARGISRSLGASRPLDGGAGQGHAPAVGAR